MCFLLSNDHPNTIIWSEYYLNTSANIHLYHIFISGSSVWEERNPFWHTKILGPVSSHIKISATSKPMKDPIYPSGWFMYIYFFRYPWRKSLLTSMWCTSQCLDAAMARSGLSWDLCTSECHRCKGIMIVHSLDLGEPFWNQPCFLLIGWSIYSNICLR